MISGFDIPRTRYAKSGDLHIAYQVIGEDPLDLVWAPPFVSHLEHLWEEPSAARFFRRLASFSRVILFDKRGTGLSDRVADSALPTLELRMDDLRAVMEAVGSERAAVVGSSDGGTMATLFTATYPERVTALILYGTFAKALADADYPWSPTLEGIEAYEILIRERWGEGLLLEVFAPSRADDPQFRQWFACLERLGASPGAVMSLLKMNRQIDVRAILPTIRVPTLILHRRGDVAVQIGAARYAAEQVAGARLVELDGADHLPWVGDTDLVVEEIERFLTGSLQRHDPDRLLGTIVFVDIVGSTERIAALGDRAWRELLDGFYGLVRRQLARFQGREIDTAGDGVFAAFDGPARAVGCATAIRDGAPSLGLEVRAGVHTGECERIGHKLSGLTVNVGARIAAAALPGEVLVSNVVKDIVAGSGIDFVDRGASVLRGVPGEWKLFAVAR